MEGSLCATVSHVQMRRGVTVSRVDEAGCQCGDGTRVVAARPVGALKELAPHLEYREAEQSRARADAKQSEHGEQAHGVRLIHPP